MAMSIGIVGCGAIGQALLREADAGRLPVAIAGITSRTETKACTFLSSLQNPPPYLERDELIARYSERGTQIDEEVFIVNPTPETSGSDKLTALPQPQSMLSMAIRMDGDLAGFLVLDNFSDADAFDHADVQRLARLRQHAVSAVAKAHLLKTLQEANQNLKETQAQLVEAEKLASLGSLVAGVAHEVNTPVGNSLTIATHLWERCGTLDGMTDSDIAHGEVERRVSLLLRGAGRGATGPPRRMARLDLV